MGSTYHPRHAALVSVVLEDFSGSTASAEAAAHTWLAVPRHARLERNDVHTADKLTLELDFTDFPFDPRLVRAAAVAYHLGTTDGGPLAVGRDSLRFLGTVDVPESALGDDELTATLECRDYTAIFLAVRATKAMAVPLDRPLDAVLGDLLRFLPEAQAAELRLVSRGPDGAPFATWPTVSGGGHPGARLPVDPKDTVWSLVRDACDRCGLVCFVELDALVVATPRGLAPAADPVRVAFGENLMALKLKRNATNLTRPVAVRQYDPRTGQVLTGVYPAPGGVAHTARAGRRTRVVVRGSGGAATTHAENTAEEFKVVGHRDQAALDAVAERVFRDRARTEIEGSFTLHEMAAPRGVGRADVTTLATNDKVLVTIAEHARALMAGDRTRGARARYLADRGYPAAVAAALADAWEHLGATTAPFVVRKATHTLSADSYQLDVDFQNLITPAIAGEV